MSESKIKAIYDALKEDGELLTFHPDLTGDWKKDKKKFTSSYNATEDLLHGIDDDDDDDFGFYEDF